MRFSCACSVVVSKFSSVTFSANQISPKIIFKSNIMYNSFLGAVKYSQTVAVG